MLSRNLEQTLHRALAFANERRHEFATLEHLLLALIDDQDAKAVMQACDVDFKQLRHDMQTYLDSELESLVLDRPVDAKPNAGFQRVLQRAAIHVQSSGREQVTGANVLVALFSERESHAAYFLQRHGMTRIDAVNFVSVGKKKSDRIRSLRATPKSADLSAVESFVKDERHGLLEARDGRIDLGTTLPGPERLAPRIEAARVAIDNLLVICREGNRQHGVLSDYAVEYREALIKLDSSSPGITWYVIAQKIENYRSNYKALSDRDSRDYPPFEAGISTVIDAVVLATGILARSYPEIAKCQDDFELYAGRQIGVRASQRELLDAALSDLANSEDVLTPRANVVAKNITNLAVGATPEGAPETARTVATKSGFLRGVLSAIAKASLEMAGTQIRNLRENIRSKAGYDISKEIVKALVAGGYTGVIGFLGVATPTLLAIANQWPTMFGFVQPLLRILGLS